MQAIIFDLGGTLVDWHDWDTAAEARWASAHAFALTRGPIRAPDATAFVAAMRAAEREHWRRVETELLSTPPETLVREGFGRLGVDASGAEIEAVLDGYARAVSGWAQVFPDSRATLLALRESGYRLGLLSNTWWAAAWHNADLASHGLEGLLDAAVYTSDLPHSKPHPSVFCEVARRLDVAPPECLMVGDNPIDDISGALGAGMRAVLKTNGNPRPIPAGVLPTAVIRSLDELPPLLAQLSQPASSV
jgi:putative hydrolase of the HAD superfamily